MANVARNPLSLNPLPLNPLPLNPLPLNPLPLNPPTGIVTTPEDKTPDYVIPLIVIIIFVAFIGFILYLLASSGFKTQNSATAGQFPQGVNSSGVPLVVCAPGACATNIQSGFKTCPADGQTITADPATQVCNSRFVCDNPLTPYALQSDLSTNFNGACEPNTECACLRAAQCANYIRSAFTTTGGNPFVSFSGQRLTFPQITSYTTANGTTSDQPPIQYNNPATTFCAAPAAWLPLASPGCNFVSGSAMSYPQLLVCMGLASGCQGTSGNACLQGTLAVLSNNPDDVTRVTAVNTDLLACVEGVPCPCGSLAIYDTSFGGVICRTL